MGQFSMKICASTGSLPSDNQHTKAVETHLTASREQYEHDTDASIEANLLNPIARQSPNDVLGHWQAKQLIFG